MTQLDAMGGELASVTRQSESITKARSRRLPISGESLASDRLKPAALTRDPFSALSRAIGIQVVGIQSALLVSKASRAALILPMPEARGGQGHLLLRFVPEKP